MITFNLLNQILKILKSHQSSVSCRWHVQMPAIVAKSISILSDAGLGMAMFSLGREKSKFVSKKSIQSTKL